MSSSMERPPRPPLLDENDRPGPPPLLSEEPRRSGRGLTVFIALFAVIVFAGIVWYAYDQGRRTGSEESAPLIRADSSPVRVRPQDPGGLKVPHQDKLIFEKLVDGTAARERSVEQLLPRPETPVSVTPAPAPAETANPAPAPAPAVPLPPPTVVAPAPKPKSPPAGQNAAVAEAPTAGTPKPAAVPPASTDTAAQAPRQLVPPPKPIAIPAPPKPAPAAKPVPKPKPSPRPVQTAARPPAPANPPASKPKPAAQTSPAPGVTPTEGGRYRIQIAAFKNEAVARSAWQRVQAAHRAQLGALSLTIERIAIEGKGTFHRVQAGPLSESKARAVCTALAARNQPCIVVRR